MSKVFWKWVNNGQNENELRIEGYIAEESWWMDEVTPKMFRSELASKKGDITVWINSYGGECVSASQIYTMLMEHTGKVTVKIDGIAASAASIIAMAGSEVLMSPTSMLMIHNPIVNIFGEVSDLENGIAMLNEVKEALIMAYQIKTGLPRAKISRLMDNETWFNARAAIEHGFADGMLYGNVEESVSFNKQTPITATASALRQKLKPIENRQLSGTPIDILDKRLELLK